MDRGSRGSRSLGVSGIGPMAGWELDREFSCRCQGWRHDGYREVAIRVRCAPHRRLVAGEDQRRLVSLHLPIYQLLRSDQVGVGRALELEQRLVEAIGHAGLPGTIRYRTGDGEADVRIEDGALVVTTPRRGQRAAAIRVQGDRRAAARAEVHRTHPGRCSLPALPATPVVAAAWVVLWLLAPHAVGPIESERAWHMGPLIGGGRAHALRGSFRPRSAGTKRRVTPIAGDRSEDFFHWFEDVAYDAVCGSCRGEG